MNARNRVFMILGLLTVGSLIWYFATVRPSGDLQLIGTVDANEVIVSSKIPGRIQTLTVDEGDPVQGRSAYRRDREPGSRGRTQGRRSHRRQPEVQARRNRQNRAPERVAKPAAPPSTPKPQVKSAQASLAQAQANNEHQQADTSRTVALAQQGIMSAQSRDERSPACRPLRPPWTRPAEHLRGRGLSAPGPCP